MSVESHIGKAVTDNAQEEKTPRALPFYIGNITQTRNDGAFDHIWLSCSVSGRLRVGGTSNQDAAELLFQNQIKTCPVPFRLD